MLGIYTRISKDRPNQLSTKEQRLQGIELAKSLKIPYQLYPEPKGTSGGKTIKQREQLYKMTNDIYDGKITAVYFYNQDRSARDELTWFTLAKLFIDNNIKLYENGVFIDLNDENVFMMTGFKAVMDASFRRKTGKRIRDVLYRLAKDGKATNPVIHYGYKKDKHGYLVLDDDEKKIIKKIFKLSLSGVGSQRIANELNENGTLTRYGKTAKGKLTTKNPVTGEVTTKEKKNVIWSNNTILHLIKSRWFIGERKYKGEIFSVPSLFDIEYWQRVNDNLQKNRLHSGTTKSHKFLLRGIMKCSCGCNMYGKHYERTNENYYKCSSKRVKGKNCGIKSTINRPRLDELIWSRFFKDKRLSELVVKHFEKTDEIEMKRNLTSDLKTLNIQLINNGKEKTKTITLTTKDIITDDEATIQLTRIRSERNKIQIQILNIENQIQTYNDILKSSSDITKELNQYKNKTSFNDKQTIIKKYIQEINVDYYQNHFEVQVFFNIPDMGQEHLIVQKRFYYIREPFKGEFEVINKADIIKKGKILKLTEKEFFERMHTKKVSYQIFKIKNIIMSHYTDKPIPKDIA